MVKLVRWKCWIYYYKDYSRRNIMKYEQQKYSTQIRWHYMVTFSVILSLTCGIHIFRAHVSPTCQRLNVTGNVTMQCHRTSIEKYHARLGMNLHWRHHQVPEPACFLPESLHVCCCLGRKLLSAGLLMGCEISRLSNLPATVLCWFTQGVSSSLIWHRSRRDLSLTSHPSTGKTSSCTKKRWSHGDKS